MPHATIPLATLPRRALLAAALAAPGIATPGMAAAQQGWMPNRPVRLVVPYPPGGVTDLVARWLGRELQPRLGQPVVVENRPGANGIIAMQQVQGAPADGHTFVVTTADTLSVIPYVYRRLPYRPEAFVPVAAAIRQVFALVSRPGFGAADARAFVEKARAARDPVTYASWGVASTSQVMMETFRAEAGFAATHVPFQGAAPAVQAMVADQVDAMMTPIGLAIAQGDRLRILGTMARQRYPGAPAVATLAEQGFRTEIDVWIGVLGPPSLPEPIADRVSALVQGFVAAPEAAGFLAQNGLVADVADRARFAATIREEGALWRERAERLGVKLDE
jgi:tripartite-type tricarboxylate transporter receptor subunit TctC